MTTAPLTDRAIIDAFMEEEKARGGILRAHSGEVLDAICERHGLDREHARDVLTTHWTNAGSG